MTAALKDHVGDIKLAVREIIGQSASGIFLGQVDKALDEAGSDPVLLGKAVNRVVKMVNLFIGTEESKVIARRCAEILDE